MEGCKSILQCLRRMGNVWKTRLYQYRKDTCSSDALVHRLRRSCYCFTLILANIFSTVLGGSLLQKGFHIDCCCQPMLYVWLVIILVFALLLIIAYFDFSEECKFGCYKCLLDTCDIYFPPTEKYIGDGCHSIYQGGGVQIAIAWGYAQVNSLFIVIPKNTVLVYFRMKVDCIPFIGIDPYEEYEAPEPTWLKKCCER